MQATEGVGGRERERERERGGWSGSAGDKVYPKYSVCLSVLPPTPTTEPILV